MYRITLVRKRVLDSKIVKTVFKSLLVLNIGLSCIPAIYITLDGQYSFFDPMVLTCWPSFTIEPGPSQAFLSVYIMIVFIVPIICTSIINICIAITVKIKVIDTNRKGFRRMYFTLTVIIWVFLFSYAGIIINLIIGLSGSFQVQQGQWFDLLMGYLVSLNIIVNPFVYYFMNKHNGEMLKTIFNFDCSS